MISIEIMALFSR